MADPLSFLRQLRAEQADALSREGDVLGLFLDRILECDELVEATPAEAAQFTRSALDDLAHEIDNLRTLLYDVDDDAPDEMSEDGAE